MKNQGRSSPKRGLLLFMAVFLMGIGGLLLFRNSLLPFLISRGNQPYTISHQTSKQMKQNQKKKASFNFGQVQSVSFTALLEAQMEKQDYPVIGDISIPELQINLPIFKGVDSRALLFGAGTLKENEEMGQGNYALASHHIVGQGGETMLFSPLVHAQMSQAIFITDKTQVWEYRVSRVTVVSSNDTHDMNDIPHEQLITLVTCEDLAATHRIIVQGQLVRVFPFDEKIAQQYFSESYHQYN